MARSKKPAAPDPADMTYEQAIDELESIIDRIERGEIGLEESLAARRRGDALVKRCQSILDTAEQELKEVAPDDEQNADDGGDETSEPDTE